MSRSANRILQLVLLACIAVTLSATLAGCGRKAPKPNIILVILDTVRRDATGLGSDKSRWQGLTPHLDQLATEGTTYPNAWATAPWTGGLKMAVPVPTQQAAVIIDQKPPAFAIRL